MTAAYLDLQEQLQQRLHAASGIDLSGVKAKLPTHIRMDLGQWFALTAAHEKRHLWQIRQIMGRPDFPR